MIHHITIRKRDLHHKIKAGALTLAGNQRLKIFGLLKCTSGKRMKKENRVFFKNYREAIHTGFRPCGHCLSELYRDWVDSS